MTDTAKLYAMMQPATYAAKVQEDCEGNTRQAILFVLDKQREGGYINGSEWIASVLAHLFGNLAAKAI